VIYLGQIVEQGSRAQIFGNPQHSYTRRLIEAVPVSAAAKVRAVHQRLSGDVPSPMRAVGDPPRRLKLNDIGGGHLVAS